MVWQTILRSTFFFAVHPVKGAHEGGSCDFGRRGRVTFLHFLVAVCLSVEKVVTMWIPSSCSWLWFALCGFGLCVCHRITVNLFPFNQPRFRGACDAPHFRCCFSILHYPQVGGGAGWSFAPCVYVYDDFPSQIHWTISSSSREFTSNDFDLLWNYFFWFKVW